MMSQPATIHPAQTIEWLNKLIMMAQWKSRLPFDAVYLFSEPQAYQEFLAQVRSGNTDNTENADQASQPTPVTIARQKLSQAVAGWSSLKELFSADLDPFYGAPLGHLQLLAEVSDITTDPQKMVYSRNGTFLAVIEALRQSQELDTEPLLVDWLYKFLTLFETKQPVAEMLYDLAELPHWLVVMASLRDGRDYTRDADTANAQTLLTWQGKLTTELRALLFKPGHLSRAPTKLIRMAWNNSRLFQEARDSIPVDERETDPVEERRQVANEALPLFEQKAQLDCDEIKADLMVLATVARHYINVRKFAKLDGFVYTWPDIARLAMSNYLALEYVEDLLVNRKPRPADSELDAREARELYELCAANDRLIRFLRLRPRFAEIDEDELRRYRPLAPVVITETVEAPASGVISPHASDFSAPPPSSPPPSPPRSFENGYLEIVRPKTDTPSDGSDLVTYEVSLRLPGYTFTGHTVSFSTKELSNQLSLAIGTGSDSALQGTLKDLFSTSPTEAERRLVIGGGLLQSQIFHPRIKDQILERLSSNEPFRLVVTSPEKELHYLPWEWLPGASPTQLLLGSPNTSVIRRYSKPDATRVGATTTGTIVVPLRLLSITPPASKGRRFTSDATLRALKNIATARRVDYKSLTRQSTTLKNIKDQLESFRPHFVHFEGYVISDSDPHDEGDDYFVTPNEPILVEEFARLLKDHGVQLLVIGRSEMKQIYGNRGAQVTLKLSEQGLPAVIAPMRGIDDASATTFTAEFYDAFLQGNTLEAALYQARRRLASKGGDWSVFALFADPARLDYFQLLRETA